MFYFGYMPLSKNKNKEMLFFCKLHMFPFIEMLKSIYVSLFVTNVNSLGKATYEYHENWVNMNSYDFTVGINVESQRLKRSKSKKYMSHLNQ